MKRSFWPLLALACARGHRLTPIQMQKILFVFGEQFRQELDGLYYRFQPYHYGPFDPAINQDIEELESKGLVEIVDTTAHRGLDYELTEHGEREAAALLSQLPQKQADHLKVLVGWVQSLTFRELVTAIYKAYPSMAENSVFR